MNKTVTALLAAAILAAATTAALPGAGLVGGFVAGAIVHTPAKDERPAYVVVPKPGYIVYSGYAAALPGPNCYWTRMPIFDPSNKVIGWRGRPVAVCPE